MHCVGETDDFIVTERCTWNSTNWPGLSDFLWYSSGLCAFFANSSGWRFEICGTWDTISFPEQPWFYYHKMSAPLRRLNVVQQFLSSPLSLSLPACSQLSWYFSELVLLRATCHIVPTTFVILRHLRSYRPYIEIDPCRLDYQYKKWNRERKKIKEHKYAECVLWFSFLEYM